MLSYDLDLIQFLNTDACISDNAPPIAKDFTTLLSIYKSMVTIRTFDYKAVALQRTGKIGTYPSVLGSEVISTVIGKLLDKEDIFVPYYRDQGAQYLRGVTLTEMLLYWGGDERGNNYINCAHDLPCSVPIGSQALHAAGAAFALKYKKQQNCALVTLGDGATSQGDFYEAINVAGTLQLPVIFVVCNNKLAISTPIEKQTHCKNLAQKAIAAGFEGIKIDGNDVIAAYQTLQKAISDAKTKFTPILIEAVSYRLSDHTTADDASRYRTDQELKKEWKKDGVERLQTYLINNKVITEEEDKNILNQAKIEVKAAVEKYLQTQPQEKNDIFNYHYENIPSDLEKQRMEYNNG